MIKSVVFDWGGVVSPAGTPDEVAVSLSKLINVSEQLARDGLRENAEDFKRGRISEEDFWTRIQSKFDTVITPSDRSIWTDVQYFKPDPKMSAFAKELKELGYDVSILSNTFPPTAADIRAKGWYNEYDTVILSSEVKTAKPDKEIYDLLLKQTGYMASETIFIDDQEKCLKPARDMGMKTVLASDTDQIITDVRALLN